MNTNDVKLLSQLDADIESKQTRLVEIRERADAIVPELNELHRKHGRAVADGSQATSATCVAEIRQLNEEQDGLRLAATIITEDLQQLDKEANGARVANAIQEEAETTAVAVEALHRIHERIQSLIVAEILPIAEKLDLAFNAARTARERRASLAGERAPHWLEDPIPVDVAAERGGTLVLLGILRGFAQGLPLHDAGFHSRQSAVAGRIDPDQSQ